MLKHRPDKATYIAPVFTFPRSTFHKKRAIAVGTFTFIILLILIGFLAYMRFIIVQENKKKDAYFFIDTIRHRLSQTVAQSTSAAKLLSFFIEKDGTIENFDSLATQIMKASPDIDALQLVPGGVIQYVYPLKGNEAMLGYNILKDSTRSKEAYKAITNKEMFFAGPLNLKQGGVGVVGRLPIFRENKFWGFAAVLVKMNTLFNAAGIDSVGKNGYRVQLSKINPDTGVEEFFINHPGSKQHGDYVSVHMPDGDWRLTATPVNYRQGYGDLLWIGVLGLLFSLLVSIAVYIVIQRPEKLAGLVQKRTRELEESEQRYRSLIEQASDGIIVYEADGTIFLFNQMACIESGYSREEFAKLNLTALLSEGKMTMLQSKADALQLGKTAMIERKMRRKDGVLVDIEVHINKLTDTKLIAVVRNITQRKKAELLLLESELKYRTLIEQASDGIIISDLQGVIMEVNNSVCIMGGYTMPDMVGRPVNDFLPKEDIELNPLKIDELIQGKSRLYERRYLRHDGSVIDVEINSKMASSGTLIGFVRDITERKNAAEALKKSKERFDAIAKATNDAIWQHDFIENVTTGNDNLYKLYGFTKGIHTITNELFLQRVHPDERNNMLQKLDKVIAVKGAFVAEEFRFKIADGSYKNIYDRAYLTYSPEGKPLKITGVMQDITARVNSQKAILKEKELSDSIINSLPAVFYLYNKDWKFLRWNKNFEEVSGYNSEEIRQLSPLDLFSDDEKLLLDKKIRNVFEHGNDYVEAFFMTKDKRLIPYYFSGMKIEYEGEICLMGFGLDFSHKVKAQQAILDSEQKFRSLVEQASDGVAILSTDGKPIYTSPAAERITGYSSADLLMLNWFHLAHPCDLDKLTRLFDKALQNPGIPQEAATMRLLHKDGSWRSIEKTVTNMYHIPSINGIVENFRDISEKLAIEKNIIAEKELSDSIINSLPGIFYLYDNTGKFIRWNRNFELVTGYNSGEIMQMHPLDFYDESEKETLRNRIKNVLQQKMPGIELPLYTKEKKKIPFYYNSVAIEYEGVACIMGMGFDVTERKKIEQQLLISNNSLEQKATELIASYSELERFAYIVSHDLQEPLRMVSSFLKLLEKKYKDKLDENGEKYIHFAVDGADRMKQLIMDLLEYSRTGTNKDTPADTDMNEVMQDVVKMLKNSIDETKAVISIAPLPVLIKTSKLQMFQLMQNLVGNALKYHGTETPLIHISVIEEIDYWHFIVKDNGIGMNPQFSEKIFIIFQRLHSRSEFSGTGIGLSICKKIVEKHGGTIWVITAPDEGSTFHFTIRK